MDFQILKLVLWPRDPSQGVRELDFRPGTVNVITGASQTGKSAVIPIVDYCLGSDACSIPVGPIRNACGWFGVVVRANETQFLFARREPGAQKSTGDMYVVQDSQIEIPSTIERPNANVKAVKRSLDELCGLTQLDFDEELLGTGFKGRPSFRDMVAFTFQPQNVVANPNTLLFKADSYEHREKLRNILPYVLGAISPETLAKRHELASLRRILRRKESEFQTTRRVSARWVADAKSRLELAKELGLLPVDTPTDTEMDVTLETLRSLRDAPTPRPTTTERGVADAAAELAQLRDEESRVSNDLALLHRRYSDMSRLRAAATQHQAALGVKRERLQIAEWIRVHHDESHECPFCGSKEGASGAPLDELHQALQRVETEAGKNADLPAAFDREFDRVRNEIGVVAERLEGVRLRRERLQDRSAIAREQHYTLTRAWRFLGGLDEAIARYDAVGFDGELAVEVEELKRRVAALEAEIREADVKRATERALGRVSSFIARLIPNLDAERPDDTVRLSIDDLTVKVEGESREDFLWEIGSGANWLSYHVATSLALQQHFLKLHRSPVPSFLVYDQPSQVYFPQYLARRDTTKDELERDFGDLRDEDVEAVGKVFKVLGLVTDQAQGRLQCIVLDHAPQDVWAGVGHVHVVEEWRGGRKLVPMDWLA